MTLQSDERPRDVIELGLLHALEEATGRMRAAQDRYFKSRARKDLIEAKSRERTVDARLRDLQTLRLIRSDEAPGIDAKVRIIGGEQNGNQSREDQPVVRQGEEGEESGPGDP